MSGYKIKTPADSNISENELRLFETIPGNNVLLKADPPHFTILAVTESYLQVTGKKRNEVIGNKIFDVFPSNPHLSHDERKTDLNASLLQVILTKKNHHLPTHRYDIQNDVGFYEEQYWNISNTPLLDDEGNVSGIIHSVTEITQQVKSEKREKEFTTIEAEHNLFLHAPIAIQILKGPQLIVEFANEQTLSVWNKGKEVIGKPLIEAMPELKEQGYIELINSVRESGKVYEAFEIPATINYGGREEVKYFNIAYQPYYEKDATNPTGVLVFATDVTEKIKASRELKQKQEENNSLASIAEASHEFIGLATPDKKGLYVNPAGMEMLGWETLEGKVIEDCVYPADRQLAKKLLDILVSEGSFSHEIRFWNERTGEPFWLQWNAFTIKNENTGDVVGLATVSPNITNLKKGEKDLKESNERFEAAIEAIQGVLWTNNAEGKMKGEQKGWEELTGQSFDEYQDYGWATAVHLDDAQATVDAWSAAVKNKSTFIFEHRLKKKDGSWGLFSIRAVPLLNEDQSIREWVGVHTDITEQKIAEQNISESEERFRRLADDSPIFVFIVEPDAEANMSFWNKTWLDYTGLSIDQALARAWDGVIHPDDVPGVLDIYVPAYKQRQPYFMPAVRVKRFDGEYRWHSFKGNPRYLAGEFIGFVGVGFDIHEQKLNEDFITQSEAQLQIKVAERTAELENQTNLLNNILVHSSNGISVTEMIRNEDGHVIDAITIMANEAAIKYSGLPKDLYLSARATELDPHIMTSDYGKTCLHTLNTGEPALIQYFLEHTGRWLELTVSRMDNEHLIHIFTDVTPIKESQLQLERTIDELKRSNQNLEEFAYAASHDLKEPIRKIHFFSDRIKTSISDRMNDVEKKSFERMEMASKRMSSLIDDLLTYSQVSLRPRILEEVDLNQLFNLVLEDLDLEIDQKKAVIKVEQLCVVQGHHRQLQQAFLNIISNALKYNKPGEAPEVFIRCKTIAGRETGLPFSVHEKEKAFYVIEISDNGIGFDQRDADRIFNVFTRLHGNIEYRGTGVGLSIVRKVIENHQGFITADSELGKGSVFKVYLPAF
jgi:PAS domain S-box-containing protein